MYTSEIMAAQHQRDCEERAPVQPALVGYEINKTKDITFTYDDGSTLFFKHHEYRGASVQG